MAPQRKRPFEVWNEMSSCWSRRGSVKGQQKALPKYVLTAEKLTEMYWALQKSSHVGTKISMNPSTTWSGVQRQCMRGEPGLKQVSRCCDSIQWRRGCQGERVELLGLKCGQYMLETMRALDTKRVASAAIQATKTSKLQRKQRKMSKTLEKDSVYYAGGF